MVYMTFWGDWNHWKRSKVGWTFATHRNEMHFVGCDQCRRCDSQLMLASLVSLALIGIFVGKKCNSSMWHAMLGFIFQFLCKHDFQSLFFQVRVYVYHVDLCLLVLVNHHVRDWFGLPERFLATEADSPTTSVEPLHTWPLPVRTLPGPWFPEWTRPVSWARGWASSCVMQKETHSCPTTWMILRTESWFAIPHMQCSIQVAETHGT